MAARSGVSAASARAGALFETHVTVSDMDRSVAFYRDVVGLEPAHELPERSATFLWAGGAERSLIGLWSLGSAPLGLVLHLAFAGSLDDVLAAPERLRAQSVEPLSFFGSPTDEPSVLGWMPAASVFFKDPDGHQLELIAMLDPAPRPELGILSWSDWCAASGAA